MKADEQELESWRNETRRLLNVLPMEYEDFYSRVGQLSQLFHEALASAMERRINPYLGSLPQESFRDKRVLAERVNGDLEALGLRIRSSKGAARLVADIRDSEYSASRFRLETYENGRTVRAHTSRVLPQLELVPALRVAPKGVEKKDERSR